MSKGAKREEFRRPAEDAKDDEEWETVESEPVKSVGTVLSVRLDADTVAHLRDAAAAMGKPASAVVRDAVIAYLSGGLRDEPVPTVTFSTFMGHVAFYAGDRHQPRQTRGVDIEVPVDVDHEPAPA